MITIGKIIDYHQTYDLSWSYMVTHMGILWDYSIGIVYGNLRELWDYQWLFMIMGTPIRNHGKFMGTQRDDTFPEVSHKFFQHQESKLLQPCGNVMVKLW
jgi:hypothetical protein